MKTLTEKFLKSVGIDVNYINKIEALPEEEEKTFDIAEGTQKFKDKQKQLLEADPETIEKYSKAADGKILEQVDRKLKQIFDLTSDDLIDKKIDEKFKLAKEKMAIQYQKSGDSLQNENIELTKKIQEYEEIVIPKVKSEVENEKKSFKINNELTKLLAGQELTTGQRAAFVVVEKKAEEKGYIFDFNEKDEFDAFTKDGKLKIKNADGTGFLTPKDIVVSLLDEEKMIKKSNGGEPAGATVIQKANPTTDAITTPAMQKAEENLRRLEEEKKKK